MKRSTFGSTRSLVGLGVVLLLIVLGVLGLTTNVFRSPRSVVAGSIERMLAPQSRHLVLDVTAAPKEGSGPARLTAHAEGTFSDPERAYPFGEGSGSVRVRQQGIELIFDLDFRTTEGGAYLRFDDLPSLRGAGDRLRGVWLELSGKKSDPPQELTAADRRRLSRMLLPTDAVEGIEDAGTERLSDGQNARLYRIKLNREKAQAAFAALAEQEDVHAGLRSAARSLAQVLNQFEVEDLRVGVSRRTKDLVRLHAVLVPVGESSDASRITITLTALPQPQPSPVAVPDGVQHVQNPEVLLRLFGVPSS